MFIEFSVKNYKSIKEQQVFSLSATSERILSENKIKLDKYKKVSVLNSAVIFGANGSGKSNLIRAFWSMQNLIRFSDRNLSGQRIDQYVPYKLELGADKDPVEFEFEFLDKEGTRYFYHVAFNATEILKEKLLYYPRVKEIKLFDREMGKEIDFGDFSGPKRKIESLLEKNQLFLTKAAKSQNDMLRKIFQTITFDFNLINNFDHLIRPVAFQTLKFIEHSKENKEIVKALLKAADISIDDVVVKKRNIDESKYHLPSDVPAEVREMILESESLEPKFIHTVYDNEGNSVGKTEFSLDEESDGTIKLFNLSAQIIRAIENGDTLFIDEINYGLHPILGLFILELFQNKEINKKNAQLVFTTHDINYLSTDIFRKDQVWFIEKNELGKSSLYSLSEFSDDKRLQRKDAPISDWYLTGRFGAIPTIKDLLIKKSELADG
jgi:AAA15 family ATPase/GTPase